MRNYAHMCRDGHVEIGHNDSESEMCPLCIAEALLLQRAQEIERLQKELVATIQARREKA